MTKTSANLTSSTISSSDAVGSGQCGALCVPRYALKIIYDYYDYLKNENPIKQKPNRHEMGYNDKNSSFSDGFCPAFGIFFSPYIP